MPLNKFQCSRFASIKETKNGTPIFVHQFHSEVDMAIPRYKATLKCAHFQITHHLNEKQEQDEN